MKHWTEYTGHEPNIVGKQERTKVDNTIYTFDIETSSYIILDEKVRPANDYDGLTDKEKDRVDYGSNMYIWQLSINDTVYYGRTWDELSQFFRKLDEVVSYKKIIFIHNLSFEFQYLSSIFNFEDVMARVSHKVMKCTMCDFNIEFRCSYFMSNSSLANLPGVYKLPVEKKVGDLDYSLLRHSNTPLTELELGYCEYDCLVVYEYIKRELETYIQVNKIPLTSTGHVRRELKELVLKDFEYKRRVKKAINTDPHIYNMLQRAFMGGYTHSNYVYTDEVLKDVDSWDFTSSYPYILVSHKMPSSEFRKCNITKREQMSRHFAYLMTVRFKGVRSKYYNHFISVSKCSYILGEALDNGRVIGCDECVMIITDVDFYLYLDSYDIDEYIIEDIYYSQYNYLPKTFINFVLDKYVLKTKYKNVPGKEVEYALEKGKFNSLYGMAVTNTIRDDVIFDNEDGWSEIPLTNEEIEIALGKEKSASFLSFAYGVWCTAYARNNLLRNVMKLDEYTIYCDTDSIKLLPGYDKSVIDEYNKFVEAKLKFVSKQLNIPLDRFAPTDVNGTPRILGLFDNDGHYEEFITQGAKKYAYTKYVKNEKIKKDANVIEKGDTKSKVLEITVAGVPKGGANCLKTIEDFRDDLVFDFAHTNKNLVVYTDNMEPLEMVDYLGNRDIVTDISGCCILPTTYVLGKSLEYTTLLTDASSKRAVYIEGEG